MKTIKIVAFTVFLGTLISCNNQKADVKSLETEVDSASYALGLNLANYIKTNFTQANKELFLQGFRNGSDSLNLLIEDKDVNKVLSAFFQKEQKRKLAEQFKDVKDEGIAFLEKNKTAKGVKTTASGLQYKVINEGKGKNAVASDKVKIHYHGTLIDGTVFDSSVDKKTPIEMGASQFVKGFSEGLYLMNEGAKYKFFIPQELGYGENPRRGGPIKPFAALVFEVELIEIK
ncbi:FKBP-type peptidyl-prolyl cis-trans isomerase FklB [Lutibacter sp. Hel_I_33_5]|uniref:FKBP-type peptidyl-prolyl cis-trans isomerase n=1 Tax=Lutibacter sp. Hel_I_33_5 TaxID=1566289 RepID=UPI0011A6E7E5|nr:FKBP-type peptidyl-prolyl cis-trans isomerase [Lutibacter sp. Hel_I_33_5]TVZ57367.1 FKBP-type peptidyl-prolyl cis-trans isomerase FklB [Lutibacter sp. Hel_I_33_5]